MIPLDPAAIRRVRAMLAAVAAAALLLAVFTCGCGEEDDAATAPVAAPAAEEGRGESYVFAVMGDSHTDGIDNGILEEALASAAANGAEFVVHTGDVSNVGAVEELERYRELVDGLPIPVYTIPGNHDGVSDPAGRSLFAEIVGPEEQNFLHRGDHFLLVDYSDTENGISDAGIASAAAAITASGSHRWRMVFTHIPLGDAEAEPADMLNRDAFDAGRELLRVTEAGSGTDGYFAGHVHGFIQYRIGSAGAWVSGGAGSLPYPVELIGFYHYLLVRVDDSDIDVEVVRL